MTNEDYEKMAVEAALPEASFYLGLANAKIAELEAKLALAQEARREIINRYNLNKGGKLSGEAKYIVGESPL